jgi:hypothetical protein
VERNDLKSVNLSSKTYGFERRPLTSLGYARPAVLRKEMMMRDEAVAAHLVRQRSPPMLPNFGSGPEIQGDAVALVQNISTAARPIAH